jgi:hypothetical protein
MSLFFIIIIIIIIVFFSSLLLQNIFRVYIFNFIEKIAPEDIHYNIQKGAVILTMAKEQSQVMLKKQHQQQQEPFENGHKSSVENNREDNGVEKNTDITTHEISTPEKLDVDEQSSVVDDVMNVCKVIMRNFIFE